MMETWQIVVLGLGIVGAAFLMWKNRKERTRSTNFDPNNPPGRPGDQEK